MKKIVVVLCALFFLTILGGSRAVANSAQKASKAEARKELKRLKNKITKARNNLSANRSRYTKAVSELKGIEKEVASSSAILRKVKKQLAKAGKKLDDLNSQKKKLLIKKIQQQKAFSQQLRAAYGTGNEEYLKLLLNQTDPIELGRMLNYFQYFNQARSNEIAALSKTLSSLKRISIEINLERTRLDSLLKHRKKQTIDLRRKQKQRKEIAVRWQQKVKNSGIRLSSLVANEKELQSIIDAVREAIEVFMRSESLKGLAGLKKKLKWPVSGKIIKKYGNSKYAGKLRWHGVLIRAKEGKSVHAISSGRVVFSDWLRGYGLLMIIDHGENYLTLYGHNQTLLKQIGDWVEPGEVISLVGNTGGQAKAALYFEMRYKNKPVNPSLWFR